MKNKIIIFEGCDKSGKSTLISSFNSLTQYNYWVLDRGFISSLVYDELFHRNNKKYFEEILEKMNQEFDIRIIYCYASDEIIQERLTNSCETLSPEISDIKRVKKLFEDNIIHYHLQNIKIDTSESIENCLNKIIKFIEGKSYDNSL